MGERLVNSFHGGDRSVGTLTSPEFKIERKFITFYVGGGKFPGRTCVNLIVDGRIVRTVAGQNNRPGGSEQLIWHVWDVSDMVGKAARIQIVDELRGPWGHVTADQFRDERRAGRAGCSGRNSPSRSGISICRSRTGRRRSGCG